MDILNASGQAYKEKTAGDFFGALILNKYIRNHNGYIAGGCFKNVFNNEKVKDIDIFFGSEEDFNEALPIYQKSDEYYPTYENENAVGFYDVVNNVSIDLVRSSFSKPHEMLSTFDFTITKFALFSREVNVKSEEKDISVFGDNSESYDNNEVETKTEWFVIYHEDFFEHLTLKRIVIDEDVITFPLNTFERIIRYSKYGYAPCSGTKVKITRAINSTTLPANDNELFIGLYDGID